jgi:hypothetical protein
MYPFSYLFAPSPCRHHYLFIPKMLRSAIRVCDPSVAFSSDAAGDAVASSGVEHDGDITRCYLGILMLLLCACFVVPVSLVHVCVCLWVCVFVKGGLCLSVQCSALPCVVLFHAVLSVLISPQRWIAYHHILHMARTDASVRTCHWKEDLLGLLPLLRDLLLSAWMVGQIDLCWTQHNEEKSNQERTGRMYKFLLTVSKLQSNQKESHLFITMPCFVVPEVALAQEWQERLKAQVTCRCCVCEPSVHPLR